MNHPDVATRLNNLGSVLKDLGEFAGARAAFAAGAADRRAGRGPTTPRWANVKNRGGVLRVQANPGRAPGRRSSGRWRIDERVGPDHPNVAIRLNNLGVVLRDQGDLAGRRAAFERALGSSRQLRARPPRGRHHRQQPGRRAAGPAIWRAPGRRSSGRWRSTSELRARPPQRRQRRQQPGHRAAAWAIWRSARAAYERALAIDEASFGPDHPDVATDVNNLGGVLQDQGDLADARAAFERRSDRRASFGPDHPCRHNRQQPGRRAARPGDLAGARAAFERALRIERRAWGSTTPRSPPASTTWAACCKTWAIWRAPGRPTSGRWRSSSTFSG